MTRLIILRPRSWGLRALEFSIVEVLLLVLTHWSKEVFFISTCEHNVSSWCWSYWCRQSQIEIKSKFMIEWDVLFWHSSSYTIFVQHFILIEFSSQCLVPCFVAAKNSVLSWYLWHITALQILIGKSWSGARAIGVKILILVLRPDSKRLTLSLRPSCELSPIWSQDLWYGFDNKSGLYSEKVAEKRLEATNVTCNEIATVCNVIMWQLYYNCCTHAGLFPFPLCPTYAVFSVDLLLLYTFTAIFNVFIVPNVSRFIY